MIAPSPVGTLSGVPLACAALTSSGFIGGSVAPKSTVPAVNWAMPAPEPTGL